MSLFWISKVALLTFILGASLYFDVKEQKIKNFITLPGAFLGMLLNFWQHGLTGITDSLAGWLIPILILLILYRINVMGAGDIKLFAAIGAIMGLPFVTYSFVYSIYCGGIIAVYLLLRRHELIYRMSKLLNYFKLMALTNKILPYCSRDDRSSKFIFSTAIIPGALIQLLITIAD